MTFDQSRSVQALAWRYPEWWSVALSGIAWAALIARPDGAPVEWYASRGYHDSVTPDVLDGATDWMLMVVAMMLPLVVSQLRATAARSLWARRDRAILGFLVGYVVVWIGAGLILILGIDLLPVTNGVHSPGGVAAAFLIAAAWQHTSLKWRAVSAGHRTIPLAARGWRADADRLRYGGTVGIHCIASCWALMLACYLAHGLTTMVCVAAVAVADRYLPRQNRGVVSGVIAALALIWALDWLGMRVGEA